MWPPSFNIAKSKNVPCTVILNIKNKSKPKPKPLPKPPQPNKEKKKKKITVPEGF